MTRRRLAVTMFVLAALVVLAITGCWGWGKPTVVGTLRFALVTIDVVDAPPVGAWFTEAPAGVRGQFSPDGQWLYLIFTGDGQVSLASVSAQQQSGLVRVDLRLKSECFMECTEMNTVQATRVHLDPAVDPASPPAVQVDGNPVQIDGNPIEMESLTP